MRRACTFLTSLLLLLIPTIVGAQQASIADDSKPTWDENVPPAAKVTVSRDSCEAFARWIETEINAGRTEVLARVITDTAIICRAATGLPDSAELVRKTLMAPPWSRAYARAMAGSHPGGLRWKLISFDWNDGRPTALYRVFKMRFADYMRFSLTMDSTGNIRVGDHVAILRRLSQSAGVRRMYTWRRSASSLRTSSERWPSFIEVCDALHTNDVSNAPCQTVDYWADLPDEIRYDIRIFEYYLVCAFNCGPEANRAAYTVALERFNDEPVLNGLLYQNDMRYGRYESALRRIRRMDSMVGGDPYLNLVRADVSLLLGHAITARNYALGYLKTDTSIAYPYWILIQASLMDRRFNETAEILQLLRSRFELPITADSVRGWKFYAEFVSSPEFRAWERALTEEERRSAPDSTTTEAPDQSPTPDRPRGSDERSSEKTDHRPE